MDSLHCTTISVCAIMLYIMVINATCMLHGTGSPDHSKLTEKSMSDLLVTCMSVKYQKLAKSCFQSLSNVTPMIIKRYRDVPNCCVSQLNLTQVKC